MAFLNSILFSIFLIAFLFQSIINLPIVETKDTIYPRDSLDSTSFLVSSGGMFTMGFFTIQSTYNNLTYLGIWYPNGVQDRIVWTANRDMPIVGNGTLSLDDSGTLRIINRSGATLFNVSNDKAIGSDKENYITRATLEDSGNFIVYDGANRTIWQSFDHPMDALLPGMKIGYNLTTRQNWTLTSSTDDGFVASGVFTLRLEQYQNSPQLLIHQRGQLYWASGPWNESTGTFPYLFINTQREYYMNVISDASGMYFTFQTSLSVSLSILLLSPTGYFQTDDDDPFRGTPNYCYGYHRHDSGCAVSNALPYCRATVYDYRWEGWDPHYVIIDYKTEDDSSISIGDCMERCWNDCNCTACSTYINGTGCIYSTFYIRYGDDLPGSGFRQVYYLVSEKYESLYPDGEVDSFNEHTYLVSIKRMFTLGFFTIPSTKLTYLGIWFTNEPHDMIIWVANRDTPVIGQAYFSVDSYGIWKVVNGSGAVFFSISVNHQVGLSSNDVIAYLDDAGFLNVVGDDLYGTAYYWQGSDHPTDTLLSFMTLGYDLRTNKSWTLTSWLSDQVPASGAFTLRFEEYQNSPQLVIYRRGNYYWASGPWNSTSRTFQFLSFVNGSHFIFPQNVNLTSVASGLLFSYPYLDNDHSIMFKLFPNGQFKDVKNKLSLTPEFCYGYESDNGCVVSALPNCRGKTDTFQLRSGDWIGGSSIKDDNSSISHADCTERCWNDCTCTGFNTLNPNGTGCIFWTAYATFRVDKSGQTGKMYVLILPKPPKKKTWVWILVSLATVLLCVLAFVSIKRRIIKANENKRRDDFIIQMSGLNSFNYGDELERGVKNTPDVKIFSLKAIMTATNNFSEENKLGQGGYGLVYKGELADGRKIAVKRLSKTSRQGIVEFKNEFILISKLQHKNLVRLYGCCIHQQEKMLIYEFMSNKSLDIFLFAQDEKDKIGWQIRFNIIEGVAQGLLYLHKYSRMKVIHRDLKVDNILLDDNMNPKIADFGMARIFQQNVNEVVTNKVVGTFGYMAPEYIMKGIFSIKSDVFSFGVLILEIVSGRRNSSFYNPDKPLSLIGYAWELWMGHASLELKDEMLGESYDVKQLLRVIHLGLLCVQAKSDDRPTMSDVIYILNNENTILPRPKQPSCFTSRQTCGSRLSESDRPVQVYDNSLTITTME